MSESVTTEELQAIARLPKARRKREFSRIALDEWKRCSADIFYWLDVERHPALGNYVYTRDPHPMYQCIKCGEGSDVHRNDKLEHHMKYRHDLKDLSGGELRGYFIELDTTRAFPLHLPYMRPIIDQWLRESIVLVEKSRDMTATWTMVMCYTWDTLFHRGRENIFQSEDSVKTLDLVERAHFIYKAQPKFLKNVAKATFTTGVGRSGRLLVSSLDSTILGFPQGPNQIRQYHPSGVYQDEAAFQVEAGDAFAAIKPAIQNGGRFTAVSSAYPSWFMHACKDTLDSL